MESILADIYLIMLLLLEILMVSDSEELFLV